MGPNRTRLHALAGMAIFTALAGLALHGRPLPSPSADTGRTSLPDQGGTDADRIGPGKDDPAVVPPAPGIPAGIKVGPEGAKAIAGLRDVDEAFAGVVQSGQLRLLNDGEEQERLRRRLYTVGIKTITGDEYLRRFEERGYSTPALVLNVNTLSQDAVAAAKIEVLVYDWLIPLLAPETRICSSTYYGMSYCMGTRREIGGMVSKGVEDALDVFARDREAGRNLRPRSSPTRASAIECPRNGPSLAFGPDSYVDALKGITEVTVGVRLHDRASEITTERELSKIVTERLESLRVQVIPWNESVRRFQANGTVGRVLCLDVDLQQNFLGWRFVIAVHLDEAVVRASAPDFAFIASTYRIGLHGVEPGRTFPIRKKLSELLRKFTADYGEANKARG